MTLQIDTADARLPFSKLAVFRNEASCISQGCPAVESRLASALTLPKPMGPTGSSGTSLDVGAHAPDRIGPSIISHVCSADSFSGVIDGLAILAGLFTYVRLLCGEIDLMYGEMRLSSYIECMCARVCVYMHLSPTLPTRIDTPLQRRRLNQRWQLTSALPSEEDP